MSEVDKHYGGGPAQAGRSEPGPRAREARTRAGADEAGMLDRAGEALRHAREGADDAAGRLRETAYDGYERAQDWAQDSYDTLSRNAVYARRRGVAEFNRGRRGVESFVDQNPIMIGVAGLAAGLLIGSLLPRTRREDEVLGPYADDMRREGVRYARDAAHQGRTAVSESLRAMREGRDPDDR